MKVVISLIALSAVIVLSEGLTCWECANARSEAHCQLIGKARECPPNENQCQIQVRYHNGFGPGFRIFKNCKQPTACDNNYVQNPRAAWKPTQCIPSFGNSVCRCCCDTDRCNVALDRCFERSQEAQCPLPPSIIYMGRVSCNNGRNLLSECTTICNSGSMLVNKLNEKTYCRGDGSWSRPFGQCKRIECERRDLENGWMSYSNNNYVGSVETPNCNYGFDLEGEVNAKCVVNKFGTAEWNKPAPYCRKRECPDRGEVVGGVLECENGRQTQSHCKVICDPGRIMEGASAFYCQDNGKWSHPQPTCIEVLCPERGTVRNGDVACTNGQIIGSQCTVVCDEGYKPNGIIDSLCLDIGEWNEPLPTCERITCPPRGSVENGVVRCSDRNNAGSVCRVRCDRTSELEGDDESICLNTGEWDRDLPKCVSKPCEDQGRLKHGSITCSADNLVGSRCEFQCRGVYEVYPPDRKQNRCLPSQQWNMPKPCCSRPCPPYALMDLVIVLDSSSSIKDENWVQMTDFVRSFINVFEIGPDAANMGVFRYNADVDTDTEIFLNDFPRSKTAFINAFNKIPYNGRGTLTGQALDHALNAHLSSSAGNRPDVIDVVLLLTDGKAKDDVAAPSKALRDSGAVVFVLGIEPPAGSGALDIGQLEEIAGGTDNLIIPEGGFESLTEDFSLSLSKTICGDPCERN